MNIPSMQLAFVVAATLIASCAKTDGTADPTSADSTQNRVVPIEITTKSNVAMVLIPSGTFMMGSSGGGPDESPRHKVSVSPFAIDKFEVAQKQFAALEIPDPSQFKDSDRPVEQIRWNNAAEFCNARSKAEGLEPCYDDFDYSCNFEAGGYRLPTEAEWEYAARAGADTDFPFGTSPQKLKSYACYAGNARKRTDPVGRKKPNDWGLHDMLGNVAEWCHDVYGEKYYRTSPAVDPRGPDEGNKRVMRGGSWSSKPDGCRVAARQGCVAGFTDACFTGNTLGFRCVRRLSAEERQRLEPATAENEQPRQ